MSPRSSTLLAWSLAALSVILFVLSIPLYIGARVANLSGILSFLLGGFLFLIFPVVGALVASRRPRNPID